MRAARIRRAVVIVLVLALGSVAGAVAAQGGLVRTGAAVLGYESADPLVVLAIGSDIGPPYRPGDPTAGRADGIHVFALDTTADRMTVVDIPRDVAIGGMKVNGHLSLGGPARLEQAVEGWAGIDIDFHVMGSFQSLTAVVQTLGGVEVEVQQRMADPFSGTDLQPGRQRLDPVQALAFTRDRRSLLDGDIGRSRNQGRLLLAAMQQLRNGGPPALRQVVAVVGALRQHTVSTIPPGEALPMALAALQVPPEAIEHVTLTGPFGFIGPASVVLAQPGPAMARIAAGQVGPPG